MKIVYIAGPMTGIKNFNRDEFMQAESVLQAEGMITHNPVRIAGILRASAKLDGRPEPEWRDYMAACAPHLVQSNEIYMLKGWDQSRGAYIEFVNAKMYGLKVRFQPMQETKK